MGIHRFGTVLRRWSREKRELNGIYARSVPGQVSSLAIDANSLIHRAKNIALGMGEYKDLEHQAVMASRSEDERSRAIRVVFQNLVHQALETVQPRDTLILAIDGPTPVAKLMQQRRRRYGTAMNGISNLFDGNCITPGTNFMFVMDDYIQKMVEQLRGKFPPVTAYSSHLDPGEGEHKIMSIYREGLLERYAFSNSANHVLFGMDSDLIMLALMSPQKNIVLIREDAENTLYIERLKKGLVDLAPENCKDSAVRDFVALMMFLGNDFVPRSPTINQTYELFSSLWDAYVLTEIPLTVQKGDFWNYDFSVLAAILDYAGNVQKRIISEDALLEYNTRITFKDDPNIYTRIPNRFIEAAIISSTDPVTRVTRQVFDLERYRAAWYTQALGIKDISALPPGTMIPSVTQSSIDDLIFRYLKTAAWTLRYYQSEQINNEWFYAFHYAPLWSDVATLINTFTMRNVREIEQIASEFIPLQHNAIEQLLAVTPLASFNTCLPPFLRKYADVNSPLRAIFPEAVIKELDGLMVNTTPGKTIRDKDESHLANILTDFPNIKNVSDTLQHFEGENTMRLYAHSSILWYSSGSEETASYTNYISHISQLSQRLPSSKSSQTSKRYQKDRSQKRDWSDLSISVIPGAPKPLKGDINPMGRTMLPGQPSYSKKGYTYQQGGPSQTGQVTVRGKPKRPQLPSKRNKKGKEPKMLM